MPFDSSGSEDAQFLLDNVIKRTLIRSLEQTQGNRRRAADLLGVSRSTLYRMLARYGLCDKPGGCGEVEPKPSIATGQSETTIKNETRTTKCRTMTKPSR